MEHHTTEAMNKGMPPEQPSYGFKEFLPLIMIYGAIIGFTLIKQYFSGFSFAGTMYDFMGAFFVVFGAFKIMKLAAFAEAYSSYDIIAKRSIAYAYAYPFIELVLGGMFLMRIAPTVASWATLVLMVVSSIGVAYELAQKKTIMCACLGTVFKIPMTYVTLAEDLLMGLMAAVMLFV